MRTNLTQDHITAIITKFFADQDSDVNFLHYGVDDNGAFSGALVDHDYSIELPDTEE